VVDARFVKPLDEVLIGAAARRSRCVVTLEDHAALGGFGSAVLELLARVAPLSHVRVCGLGDEFVEHGDQREQWRAARIDPESVARMWNAGCQAGSALAARRRRRGAGACELTRRPIWALPRRTAAR
jgi:deoxyxylulose-5-phosphate synthase